MQTELRNNEKVTFHHLIPPPDIKGICYVIMYINNMIPRQFIVLLLKCQPLQYMTPTLLYSKISAPDVFLQFDKKIV